MNLKEQQYIVALAECGSITQAAKKLGVTQPALSSYLSSVEGVLGQPLFERTGRRLLPTFLGEIYLEKARKILALGEEFDEQLELVTHGYQGRLRVGIPIRRSPQLIPSALKMFHNYYPNVELIFHEGNLKGMAKLLNMDQLDLMLCNLTEAPLDLEYISLCQDPVIFLVQASHPNCRHAQYRNGFSAPWINLKEFEQEVFILQHEEQSLRQYSDHILEATGVHPRRTALIRNIETAAQMAASGLGVSFCLKSYIQHMNFIQMPQVFSVGEQQLTADFSAAYPKGKKPPDYAVRFVELLQELMSMEIGW